MPAVIPIPTAMTTSDAPTVVVPQVVRIDAPPRLEAAARHLVDGAGRFLGVDWRRANAGQGYRITLAIDADDPRFDTMPSPLGVSPSGADPRDEAYRLSATGSGIEIVGRSEEGVFRAISTLIQSVESQDGELLHHQLTVTDAPRYAWRGLSLDVVRTFFTVAEVKQVIDMLVLYKFNVLHLHLTDDQGWRLEIDGYPELTEVGATGAVDSRPGGFYTKADYAELVGYAAERFVTIVPEVEMPAHIGAVARSLPDLAVDRSGRQPWLNPDDPATREFVRDVLREIASQTPGPYLHIAGDEPSGMPDDDYVRFVDDVVGVVRDLGKKVVGWQEIGRTDIGPAEMAQYWVSFTWDPESLFEPENVPEGVEVTPEYQREVRETFSKAAADAERLIAKGARVLLSPASFVYFDTPYGEPSNDPAEKQTRARLGIPAYGAQTIEAAFGWDPATILPAAGALIAGVEGAIWCETVRDFEDLQFLLLPRLPGVAERAWSTKASDWDDYRGRLSEHARLWRRAGWTYFAANSVWPRATAPSPVPGTLLTDSDNAANL